MHLSPPYPGGQWNGRMSGSNFTDGQVSQTKNKLAIKPGSAPNPHIKTCFLIQRVDKIGNSQKWIRKKSNETESVLSIVPGPKSFFTCDAFSEVFGEMYLEDRLGVGDRGMLLSPSTCLCLPFPLCPWQGRVPFLLLSFLSRPPSVTFSWSFLICPFG